MKKLSDFTFNIKNRDLGTNKVFSAIITLLVIGLLVFVGPVNALQLNLTGLSDFYTAGEIVTFNGEFVIEQNDIPEIKNVSLEINGYEACTIDIWGWILSGCDGVTITLYEYDTAYGYGYGYNQFVEEGNGSYAGYGYSYGYHLGKNKPGRIAYNISVETPGQAEWYGGKGVNQRLWYGGSNDLQLVVNTGQQRLESETHIIMVNPVIGRGDGLFSIATDDNEMTLAGSYNSTERSLVGALTIIGQPTSHYIGIGNYEPVSPTEGTIEFRLYNSDDVNDVGIFWYGNYSAGRWYLSPDPLMPAYIEGHVIAAPQ